MRIKNWHSFQHYKDRDPKWIKLYRGLLDDIEWHLLDAEAAKVLVMLWLIAAEKEGNLPDIKTLAFRLRMSEQQVTHICSKLHHWLEQDASNVIAEPEQVACLEKSREEKKREEKTVSKEVAQAPLPDWVPSESWAGYVEMRKKIRKPMTDRARKLVLASLERMHEKGIDVGLVLDNSTKNSWIDVYEPKESSRQVVNLFAGAI